MSYRLERIYDLRPFDWDTGRRIPLTEGEAHECDRCARQHAVVWVLREMSTGNTIEVGSACGKALGFGGADMERAELRLARKAERERRAAIESGILDEWIAQIAKRLESLRLPTVIGSRFDAEIFGEPFKALRLVTDDGTADIEQMLPGQTVDEMKRHLFSMWYGKHARHIAEELSIPESWSGPRTSRPRYFAKTWAVDQVMKNRRLES